MDLLHTSAKAFSLLDRRMRSRWAALVPIAVTSALLESVGALLVLGMIRLITDPTAVAETPIIGAVRGYLSEVSDSNFLIIYGVIVAVFYAFKNTIKFAETYARESAANTSLVDLSSRLLRCYLRAPYPLFLERNSVEFVRNVHETVQRVCNEVLASSTAALSEALVLLGVLGILFYAAPGLTLVACIALAVITVITLRATQSRFSTWGKRLHVLQASVLKTLQEGYRGIKDIKVLGREDFFARRFTDSKRSVAQVAILSETLRVLPRLVVETLFVAGVVVMIVLAAIEEQSRGDLLSLLALFAYAMLRALPSVHLIVYHANNIRYGGAAVDEIHDDWAAMSRYAPSNEVPAEQTELDLTRDIVLNQVSYSYPLASRTALADINLTIEKSHSIGIVGPTGAGKTTLIDLILGLLRPTEGQVLVDGVDIGDNLRSWQAHVGYVSQAPYLMDDSIRQNIALGLEDSEIDEARVEAAVQAAQLTDFVAALPNGLDTRVGEAGVRLSGGEHQRIATARALYRDPKVLVFDEATSSLDHATEQALSRALAELRGNKTIIIIAHRLSTVRTCDVLVLMVGGRIADIGSYDELAARNAHFREIAGLVETER